jgi:hypothetical protein
LISGGSIQDETSDMDISGATYSPAVNWSGSGSVSATAGSPDTWNPRTHDLSAGSKSGIRESEGYNKDIPLSFIVAGGETRGDARDWLEK